MRCEPVARECSCWSVERELLHDLHELFLCGDTPVLLLEPGEFTHKLYLLFVSRQPIVMLLEGIESQVDCFASTMGRPQAKMHQTLYIQPASFDLEEQPRDVC